MNYTFFDLDKNPKQFKKLTIGSFEIELRIEWNTRAKTWYVLGYIGDDLVLRNTKIQPKEFYRFDLDSDYYLPYIFTIYPTQVDADWDTPSSFVLVEDSFYNIKDGLTDSGTLVDRTIATSSNTHSKKARKTNNAFLFDLVIDGNDQVIVITCTDATESFITIGIPQGRWDFIVNNVKNTVAITEGNLVQLNSLMNSYGINVESLGDGSYMWVNNTQTSLKMDAVYPYSDSRELTLNLSSNPTLKSVSEDGNGWVNRFSVCMAAQGTTSWNITSSVISNDYRYVNFTGDKGLYKSTAQVDITQSIIDKIKIGEGGYALEEVANELTGVTDWVLDPANNQIKYYEEPTGDTSYPTVFSNTQINVPVYTTVQAKSAAQDFLSRVSNGAHKVTTCTLASNKQSIGCNFAFYGNSTDLRSVVFVGVANPAYDPDAEREEKSIPLEVVAAQVISNAKSGNVSSQALINEIVQILAITTTSNDLKSQFELNKQLK